MRNVVSPGMPAPLPFPEDPPPMSSLDVTLPEGDDPESLALANFLRVSSPGRAYRFALDRHECACESGDGHWSDLWRSVVETLRACHERGDGQTSQQSASRPVERECPRERALQVILEVENRQVPS